MQFLKNYNKIICIDGASNKVISANIIPDYILGDLDSISKKNITKFKDKIIKLNNQNFSDLQKSLKWLKLNGIKNIDIII